jgi:hypothetical protein
VRSRISARADRSSSLMSAAIGLGPCPSLSGCVPRAVRYPAWLATLLTFAWARSKRIVSHVGDLHITHSMAVARWRLVHSRMRFLPKTPRDLHGIHPLTFPPRDFIASLMQLSMMPTAKRHGEFIADFKTDRPRLSETQVMRIRRLSSTD